MSRVVSLPASVIRQYRRFSLYNSPYAAHDEGRGIDLYPETNVACSPVAGEVLDTRTVRCPDRPYAVDTDHLLLIDTGDSVARLLHVDPAVEPGETVTVGDPLGRLVRSGFFGRWVDNHIHLEFRAPDANLSRASGSIPLTVDVAVTPVAWDGTGRVVDTGETFAVLDSPRHPDSGSSYAALAAAEGVPLDGGLPHYTGGGRLDRPRADDNDRPRADDTDRPRTDDDDRPRTDDNDQSVGDADASLDGGKRVNSLTLLGTTVCSVAGIPEETRSGVDTRSDDANDSPLDGRTVAWEDVAVRANGKRVTGLSLFASREPGFGVKIVSRPDAGEPAFTVGESVTVTVEPVREAVRLG